MHAHHRLSNGCESASTATPPVFDPSSRSFPTLGSTCESSQTYTGSRSSFRASNAPQRWPTPVSFQRRRHEEPRAACTPPSGLNGIDPRYQVCKPASGSNQPRSGLYYRRSRRPNISDGIDPLEAARPPRPQLSTASDRPGTSSRRRPPVRLSKDQDEPQNIYRGSGQDEPQPNILIRRASPIDQQSPINEALRTTRYPKIADPVDKRRTIPKWQVWVQRMIFFAFVTILNLACAVTAFEAPRHMWVLGLLVFIKSKDILSTMIGIFGGVRNSLQTYHDQSNPSPKWILSLICAYAETEEQIMKTVTSTIRQNIKPHKQVLCVILDGKPCPIKSYFASISHCMRRPYITWQAKRGELAIYAGWIEDIPAILIEKMCNAGKKDSLILGHSLFNYPRDDAPLYSTLLRDEIMTKILPNITQEPTFPGFDLVFCTDADSTLHDDAMRNLARALAHDKDAVAACGALLAELAGSEVEWTTWHLFQQFQYTFGQFVRRRAEGVWGRVTCLPGCITMIAVRPEFGPALKAYALPVENLFLLQHQVQYLGTDRRLTWCMLSQGKQLRSIFVSDAISETVAPQTLEHYLSQRRRWASNAYFNDFYYTFSPNQRLITRLFGLIDLFRLTLVFYRVINTGLFLHHLVTNFYVIRIIPLLIVTKTPALWFAINVVFEQPVLRRRLHKLLIGLCIDQIISPFLSVMVFVNVIFHMGSPVWGKTGVSTEIAPMVAPPLKSVFSHDWTAERLNSLVRDVVRSRREDETRRLPRMTQHRSL